MASQTTTRVISKNIFNKHIFQSFSKINIFPNCIQLKSISWSLRNVIYILTWAQLWQQRRKKWMRYLLKMREQKWGLWKGGSLLGAAFFRFGKQGIKDEELENAFDDQLPIMEPNTAENSTKELKAKNSNNEWWKGALVSNDIKNKLCENGWECLVSKTDLVIFRKPKPNSTACIYKVFGRYTDISASDFFFTQVDNSYRKSWDIYVSDIICLDESQDRKQELLYWVVKYPYPMMSRDYLLVRRTFVDRDKNRLGILTRTTSHCNWPPTASSVRVEEYYSSMFLFPHTNTDQIGFDFHFTSVDNPKTILPQRLTNYTITSGIPDYIGRLYKATKALNQLGREQYPHY